MFPEEEYRKLLKRISDLEQKVRSARMGKVQVNLTWNCQQRSNIHREIMMVEVHRLM